jgi:ankyrin repeat protein
MVESQKIVALNAMRNCDMYRAKLRSMSVSLNLETAKCEVFSRQKSKEEEEKRYEMEKIKAETLQNDLRLAIIDHGISNTKKKPAKLLKMKEQLDDIESRQSSQKQLLKYLGVRERAIEELSSAAQIGDVTNVRNLVRSGVGVNDMDSQGYLPLHYACASGHTAVVKLLLELGSDVSSYLTGYAPIVLAARNGHHEILQILVNYGANVEESGLAMCPAIVAAASNCHVKCVEKLLVLGANINGCDIDGNTAVHVAAMHLKPCDPSETIRYLMMRGANTKIANKKGLTAIQVALGLLNSSAMEALGGRLSVTADTQESYDDRSMSDSRTRKSSEQSIAGTVTVDERLKNAHDFC